MAFFQVILWKDNGISQVMLWKGGAKYEINWFCVLHLFYKTTWKMSITWKTHHLKSLRILHPFHEITWFFSYNVFFSGDGPFFVWFCEKSAKYDVMLILLNPRSNLIAAALGQIKKRKVSNCLLFVSVLNVLLSFSNTPYFSSVDTPSLFLFCRLVRRTQKKWGAAVGS